MKTSLDTKSPQWTAHRHREKVQATRPPGPDGEGQMDGDPEARRRMRGKTRPISSEQPAGSPIDARPDATPQEAERDHDDKRRRIDELVSTGSTVAQD